MLLYFLASDDYTVGVIVWTDTGHTYIMYFTIPIILAMFVFSFHQMSTLT
jgi:hypothetical protein